MVVINLANMREKGVRELFVQCLVCGQTSDVNVDSYPADLTVPSFTGLWPCSKCGSKNNAVRPAWHEGSKHLPPHSPGRCRETSFDF